MTKFKNAKIILVIAFVLWRGLLQLTPLVGQRLLGYRENQAYTDLSFYTQDQTLSMANALRSWANFDGVHYINIARGGYQTEARFFPLLPILIKGFTVVTDFFSDSETFLVSGLVLANVFTALSLVMIYKLMRLDYPKKRASFFILFLLIFPSSFFLISVYSESLFLFLLILSFYFARKGQWGRAAVAALLLSLTRLTGILIWPALLYEAAWANKSFSIKELVKNKTKIIKKSWTLAVVPLGLIAFSFFNQLRWGSWSYFLTAHGELGNSRVVNTLVFPLQTIWRYLKILSTLNFTVYEWWVAQLELGIFILMSYLFYHAWERKVRTSYMVFGLLAFALPLFSGTFSGLPRYSLVLFPAFIGLSLTRNRWLKILYSALALPLLLILATLFSRGYFIA